MNKYEILDSIGYIDDQWITEYEEAKTIKKKTFPKWIFPVAACLIVIAVMIPTIARYNAPDKEYEARHTRFFSAAEAEETLGADFPFSKLTDKEKTEITLGIAKGGSFSDKSTWAEMEYYTSDKKETIDIWVYFPAYIGTGIDHLSPQPETILIGDTEVLYSCYEKGSPMCQEDYYFAARFEYGGNRYSFGFFYADAESAGNAWKYLEQILGN